MAVAALRRALEASQEELFDVLQQVPRADTGASVPVKCLSRPVKCRSSAGQLPVKCRSVPVKCRSRPPFEPPYLSRRAHSCFY